MLSVSWQLKVLNFLVSIILLNELSYIFKIFLLVMSLMTFVHGMFILNPERFVYITNSLAIVYTVCID